MPTPHFDRQGHGPATLRVLAWPDQVIDTLGHDPRSPYVERFWLPRLGPSTTFLLRLLAAELDASPAGVDLDLAETAARLGLGHNGRRHSPFARSLTRLVQFDLAEAQGHGELAVRRHLPPLSLRQVRLLTPALQAGHRRWQEDQLIRSPDKQRELRANRLALTLAELGEDGDATRRQLQVWGFSAREAEVSVSWASQFRGRAGPGPARDASRSPAGGVAPREAEEDGHVDRSIEARRKVRPTRGLNFGVPRREPGSGGMELGR